MTEILPEENKEYTFDELLDFISAWDLDNPETLSEVLKYKITQDNEPGTIVIKKVLE